MSAYRVVLLDCDLCGEVLDLGPHAVAATYALVRRQAVAYGWRSWRNVDVCSNHDELTMPQVLDAVDERREGR